MPVAGFVPDVTVNCRIGSLERKENIDYYAFKVNCRIGSLENMWEI